MPNTPFDLNILRGWAEDLDSSLHDQHAVGALAQLVLVDEKFGRDISFGVHGPEIYIGRFHPQNGPVDLIPSGLYDEEVYKISAPHVRLSMSPTGSWTVRPMTTSGFTRVNGKLLMDISQSYPIEDGQILKIGTVEMTFRPTGLGYQEWREQQKALLIDVEVPTLFLIRSGAVCGPSFALQAESKTLLGRSVPSPGDLPDETFGNLAKPDWDLSGLFDFERKFVGFHHLEIWCEGDDWQIKPISTRQRTYLNRVELSAAKPLMPGDEIGLGPVLLHFHHPSNIRASTDRRTVDLPNIIDWNEGGKT